jgi:GNAT superfamily N-acetyltransferase
MRETLEEPVDDISFLDELAANARPARVQQALEGWRLRAADGITRRANSVLTNAPIPAYPAWLEAIEEFYRRQGLPARYQLSPASPPGLDGMLEARGYTRTSQTAVMVGTVQSVLDFAAPSPDIVVSVEELVTDRWLDAFMLAEGFPAVHGPPYKQAFSTIGPRAAFALSTEGEQPTGVGIAVAERGWSGLFSVATSMPFRRRGIGRAIVRSLALWSRDAGAPQIYLQVVAGNTPAVNLYMQLGFTVLYSYHYREKALG